MTQRLRQTATSLFAGRRIFGHSNLQNNGVSTGAKAAKSGIPWRLNHYHMPKFSAYKIPGYVDDRIKYFQEKHRDLLMYEGIRQAKKGQGKQAQLRAKEAEKKKKGKKMTQRLRQTATSLFAGRRIFGHSNLQNNGVSTGAKAAKSGIPWRLNHYHMPKFSAYKIPGYVDDRIKYFQEKHRDLLMYEGIRQAKKGQGKQAQLRAKEAEKENAKKAKAKGKQDKKATKKLIDEAAGQ
eukprot:TRINITY_DN3815_c0_g2_i1.p1 TRINITY_DN3815_c0_g2~~TRINITY_DN3815_c0_g2_i1.p1  ORF type:complete len:249 (+),score=58.42 TRINITY_DN3815_c0_g2_i1:42-749(+)